MKQNSEAPKLARRAANRKSTIKSGRTIGEQRERLETASERTALHKKAKLHRTLRIVFTVIGFIIGIALIIWLCTTFFQGQPASEDSPTGNTMIVPYEPTIEIVDEDAAATGGRISSRTKEYIGQVEADFRELGIIPLKAVLPTGTIREIDFYIEDYTGFIKTTVDRGSGVTAEDTERMLRYLESIGVSDFQYIDVRLDGKAYWK